MADPLPMPRVMQKPKVPVEVLGAILDEDKDVPEGWVRLDNGDVLEVLRMSELRRSPGDFLDNVSHGRRMAVMRKGKLLAVLEPPPTKPTRKRTLTELELEQELNAEP